MNKKIIFLTLICLLVVSGFGCAKKEAAKSETPQGNPMGQVQTDQTGTPAKPIDGAEVSKKIFDEIDKKFPGEWSVSGTTLKKGDYTENGNFKIADEVLAVYPGAMVSLFVGETRISGTIKDEKGNRVLEGYPTPADVPATMKSGQIKVTNAGAMGSSSFQKVYLPIKSGDKTLAVMTVSIAQ